MGRGEARSSRASPKPINPQHETMMGFANKNAFQTRFYWLYPSYGTNNETPQKPGTPPPISAKSS